MRGCTLDKCNFMHCRMRRVDLTQATIGLNTSPTVGFDDATGTLSICFESADLSQAYLNAVQTANNKGFGDQDIITEQARRCAVSFHKANLSSAYFHGAKLDWVNFEQANLSDARLVRDVVRAGTTARLARPYALNVHYGWGGEKHVDATDPGKAGNTLVPRELCEFTHAHNGGDASGKCDDHTINHFRDHDLVTAPEDVAVAGKQYDLFGYATGEYCSIRGAYFNKGDLSEARLIGAITDRYTVFTGCDMSKACFQDSDFQE